jgi:hypothetical protein
MRNGTEGDPRETLAALGPFFAVEVHHPGAVPGPGWRPWSDLLDRPEVLRARAEATRAVLAAGAGRPAQDVPLAVAASVVQLGLSARLLSPLLGLAALHHAEQLPAADDLHWQDTPGGAVPLSLPADLLDRPPHDMTGGDPDWPRWAERLARGLVADLTRAAADLTPSPHTRTGNAASAVHGAVTVLAAAGPQRTTPQAAERARDLGRLLLDQPALRAAATGDPGTPGFRRRNCCLIYRTAGRDTTPRPICGDCVLTSAPRHGELPSDTVRR